MQDEVLQAAIRKAEAPGCAPESLSIEESTALSLYVSARLAESGLPDAEYSRCVSMQRLIAARAQIVGSAENPLDPEAARRRTNWTLRNAIEKTRQGRPQELTEHEVNLVENTLRGLTAMSEPSENHRRLQEILEQALDVYYTYYAESVKPAKGAAPIVHEAASPQQAPRSAAPIASTAIPTATFLQGGQRRKMEYLGAIPLNLNLYYYQHEGDLHLTGDIGNEFFLEVRGALRLDGSVYGVVMADRGVVAQGDINGGSVLTFDGNIDAARIQAGSRVIAPRGSINCSAIERGGLVFCAGRLQVAGDLHESHAFCSSVDVRGVMGRGSLSLLDGGRIHCIAGDDGKNAHVEFRAVHSAIDFGGSLESGDAQTLKEYVRARFDVELIGATQRYFEAEYLNFLRGMICLLQGGAHVEAPLAALREVEVAWAILGVTEVAASELMLAVRRAIELPGVPDLTALSPAMDVCQRAIRFLKAEAEGVPQDLVPHRRQRLASAVSQLANLAKQVRDAGAGGGDLSVPYFALRDRCAEWHAEGAELASAMADGRGVIVETLGPLAAESSIEALLQHVRKAQDVTTQGRSRLLPPIKKFLEHYAQSSSRWGAGMAEARQRLAHAEGVLRDSGAVQFAGTAAQVLQVGEGGIAEGIQVSAASFLDPANPTHRGALFTSGQAVPKSCTLSVVAGGIVLG